MGKKEPTFSHPQHLMHNVNASDALCDGMFNLQASVHLQEVKILLLVHQKLHSACKC